MVHGGFGVKVRRAFASLMLAVLACSPGLARPLSPGAKALVEQAFRGLEPNRPVVDAHVHLVGTRHGCEVNPRFLSRRHPFKRAAGMAYLEAGGTRDLAVFDEVYL